MTIIYLAVAAALLLTGAFVLIEIVGKAAETPGLWKYFAAVAGFTAIVVFAIIWVVALSTGFEPVLPT